MQRRSSEEISESRRSVVRRNQPKRAILPTINISSLGFADARSVCQHSLKYWLKLAWRRADDAQHLRCSFLPLQRLIALACSAVELFLPVRNGRMTAARDDQYPARLRLSNLGMSRFTACATPFHLALQFQPEGHTLSQQIELIVRDSKMPSGMSP